jgi:transcription antitermination factor NusG
MVNWVVRIDYLRDQMYKDHKHWYMLRVHRGAEERVRISLDRIGIEGFYLLRFIVQGCTVKFVPLTGKSSGYLFVRFAPAQVRDLRRIHGFVSVPPINQLPIVCDEEIDQIRRRHGLEAVAAFGRAMQIA